ncbi:phosphate uptake regulator PhoU [Methanolapillus millepedarum]|uniref:SpoVT-AbrB domain-containing protein n=1 Tax=Methanolapillus millepedarum TaxID=3028296 RepID=A0AA96V3B7_9EURY|nr:hypothetical protein MsAc7_01990 [Methanosarcinaceae archaeon Ac7]
METRKVQQTGGSTYIISLPKQWADKVGISPGIRVGVQPQPDGKLLICPTIDSKPLRKKTIDITNITGQALERTVIAAYLAGYDIIEFVSPKILAEQKKILRTICYKLIGPEIIEENSNSVLVQDLLNPNDLSIKKAIQRMYLISNSMFCDAIISLKNCDLDLATDIDERDDEVDRLYLVISKQFKSILCGTSFLDTNEASVEEYHDLRMAATPIERIADHSQKIARVVLTMKPKIDTETMSEIEKISLLAKQNSEKTMDALYSSNAKLANQAIENQKEINALIEKFNLEKFNNTTKLSFDNVLALRIVMDSIGRIGDYSTNIAEIAINASIESK